MPTTGATPRHIPMFKNVWKMNMPATPAHTIEPRPFFARRAIHRQRYRSIGKHSEHSNHDLRYFRIGGKQSRPTSRLRR